MTWQPYGQALEAKLQDVSKRLARGAYRATAVRRAYIPQPDGRQRPLGVPALEDKIVQCVTAWIGSVIWEEEFRGFAYGLRPGRSPHHALEARMVGMHRKRVHWILTADIQGFFDHVSHAWLVRFVEHWMGDKRVVRRIQQWRKAGGQRGGGRRRKKGSRRGGASAPSSRTSISSMRLTSGHTTGGSATHGEMSSWCGTPTTSCWASSIGPKRSSGSGS